MATQSHEIPASLNSWFKQHSWPLIIAIVGLVSTWALYGYRITEAENDIKANTAAIEALRETASDNKALLARIQADIEYIKLQVSKLAE